MKTVADYFLIGHEENTGGCYFIQDKAFKRNVEILLFIVNSR